jgi:hypothetical protein
MTYHHTDLPTSLPTGEQLLAQRRNGEDVKQSSIGIERQCLDCPELSARLSADRRAIAKRFGVDPGTVQRISRPFAAASVAVA